MQKGALALVALDQADLGVGENGQNQAGKSGAAAEIDQLWIAGQQRRELGRVEEVPAPWIGERAPADEIDARLPSAQELQIHRQPLYLGDTGAGDRAEVIRMQRPPVRQWCFT